ncbi:MAG: ribosome silencing factor [Bacteroidales bacterium]|nr:ribosome silencing factor [Bacteroidales bacterium]
MLTENIIKGIQEKKGREIKQLNFKKIFNSICDYFIICEGTSNIQVQAIADSVEEVVFKATGEKPIHKEGFQIAEWIILDYFNVVVHIFQKDKRSFYNIEDLWADADMKNIDVNY